ncbi:tetratricopeptide repeat protein [Pontibacter pamirensis]|uniref:tetratricopeptide repeat protein n=1 Tax=Pontibacter pamirensis TaxID=2562824 RepID=UPI00138A3EEA|nr:tetratricopeptide repeat protein [Pontibacter pamirensis]
MRRLFKIFLLASILCAGAPAAMAGAPFSGNEQLLQQAKQLLNSYKDSEALLLYEQVLAAAPDNYEALCKASLLHCRIGERYSSDETSKMQHFSKAKKYAQKAYELDPVDAESNFVMALSIGAEAMASGAKERLVGINEVKTFLDAALASNRQHAEAWHIMGRWYFKMANLNLVEKVASKMLFGGVCDEATNTHAAEALENAIANDPNNIRYYYDLACIYNEMKDTAARNKTLEKAVSLTYETKEELELSRRCKIMLQE